MLRRHKYSIIGLLQPTQAWDETEWRAYFDERAAIIEFDGRLPRQEAEELAFKCCLVEWLGQHPVASPSDRCLWCAEPDRTNDSLLPVGVAGAGAAWLHVGCSTAWCTARKAQAAAALGATGIRNPAGAAP